MNYSPTSQPDQFATSFEYLALIFLILTFVIGAVYLPNPAIGTGMTESTPTAPAIIGTFSPRFAFTGRGARIRQTTIDAIAHVLRSHDITAEISLFLDRDASVSPQERDRSTMRAVARAVTITRALRAQGVRAEDLRVVVVPVVRSRTLQVRMRREPTHG